MRTLILLHRYLGMAVGIVVSLWCLSAFVMMYVQYPEFSDAERTAGLEEIDLTDCCGWLGTDVARPEAGRDMEITSFRIEMLAGRPVLRLLHDAGRQLIDLRRGEQIRDIDDAFATDISDSFAERFGIAGPRRLQAEIDRDQWTVYASYHPHRPLYRFAADDGQGSVWYVSSRTGEVVQITTARERFWNWIGAVTHWIYFTEFRQYTGIWAQTIIWLTIFATVLAVLGIYIGIKRLRRRRNGRISPYRGFGLWHHYAGLVFGVLVVTWLVSGFFSMNPWGALEGRSFAAEETRLRGASLTVRDAFSALRTLSMRELPAGTVRIDSSVVDGRMALVSWLSTAERYLLDPVSLEPVRLADAFFERAAGRLRPDAPIDRVGWLERDDAYYFNHHEPMRLPVFRIQYADGERFYLDTVTAELVHAVDGERQWYRWLFEALHRGDFAAVVRERPMWDFVMLPLLLGVTISVLTGTWMGMRRLARGASRRRRASGRRAGEGNSSEPMVVRDVHGARSAEVPIGVRRTVSVDEGAPH